jgi:hypothetical protein
MLNNEISGAGLKERVTACRKRLRENRAMFRAQAATDVEELFPETRLNRSLFADDELKKTTALLEVEDQEVGIT